MEPTFRASLSDEWRRRRVDRKICFAPWLVVLLGAFVLRLFSFKDGTIVAALPYAALFPNVIAGRTALRRPGDLVPPIAVDSTRSARRAAWLRLLGGWTSLVLPLAVVLAILYPTYLASELMHSPPPGTALRYLNIMVGLALCIVWLTTELYLVLSWLGTFFRRKGRFFAAATLLMVALGAIVGFGFDPYPIYRFSHPLGILASAIAPNTIEMLPWFFGTANQRFEAVFGLHVWSAIVAPLALNLLLQGACAIGFVRRYAGLALAKTDG